MKFKQGVLFLSLTLFLFSCGKSKPLSNTNSGGSSLTPTPQVDFQDPILSVKISANGVQGVYSSLGGSLVSIGWEATGAEDCALSVFGLHGLTGKAEVYPTVTTTYAVTCTSGTKVATATVKVFISTGTPNPSPTPTPSPSPSASPTITPSPTPPALPGTVNIFANAIAGTYYKVNESEPIVLSWQATNVISCAINPLGFTAFTGNYTVPSAGPTVTTEYRINCLGNNLQTVSAAVLVVVPQVSITANNVSGTYRRTSPSENVVVRWSAVDTSTCIVMPINITAQTGLFAVPQNLSASVTYTISCIAGTATITKSVIVETPKNCQLNSALDYFVVSSEAAANEKVYGSTIFNLPADAFDLNISIVFMHVDDYGPQISLNGTEIVNIYENYQGSHDISINQTISGQLRAGQNTFSGSIRNYRNAGPASLSIRLSGTYFTYGSCL